jgi:membrane associated rhomboid family serine protease
LVLSIVLGAAGFLAGLVSWMGLLPTKRRTSWFKGGVHGELMIMGPGVALLGVAGLYQQRALGLVAFAIVLGGFILGLVSPSWLFPRWYKERYPDPPPGP